MQGGRHRARGREQGLLLAFQDSATGEISGTPTARGTFPFSVTATDSLGARSAPKSYSMVVNQAIAVSPAGVSLTWETK